MGGVIPNNLSLMIRAFIYTSIGRKHIGYSNYYIWTKVLKRSFTNLFGSSTLIDGKE